MEESELSRSFRTLTRLHRGINSRYLEQYNLYLGQPRILFLIDRNPGITVSRLVEETEQTKEALSVSVRRLEEAGYLRKERNPEDQREKFLYLSEQGKIIADTIKTEFLHLNNAMFEPLTENEKVILEALFTRMSARLIRFKEEHQR